MPREKDGFREQYDALAVRYPNVEAIDVNTCAALLGIARNTIMGDKTFPAKKVGGKYIVTLVALARWLCG